ncbi:MAG: SUMF1/EgtB/PvdO family nonheme iron enzyme [Candidatus Omnitrophota bacterium]|nr:MAG: SUMF1/EgtB/PvdO family nonheme iron enzyme [Candidatus Omnitrophota bacterium]
MQFLIIFIFIIAIPAVSFASNVVLENISLEDKDTTNDTYDMKFDVSWDNSWRITGSPSPTANWDAVWLFAKYSAYSDGNWSDWGHCSLLNTGNVAPAGSQMDFAATFGVYRGVFIYRSAAGSGSVDWNDAEIRWAYGTDGVADSNIVKIKVFAIEMVYIPTCNFYVGDGTNRTGSSNSHFFDAADATNPRDPALITSNAPYISNVNNGTGTAGDITWVNESAYAGNLPAARTQLGASYPTGYNAFYIMKYEISQGQYKEFLNTLTRTQQNSRTASQAAGSFVMPNTGIPYYRNGIRAPASIPSGPITFGCDLDGDGIFNESTDGEEIAANYLSWRDTAAYADWAALRPFSELEFEKAARGGQAVVAREYAWGSTSITQATGISNSGQTNEVPSNAANCVYGNHGSVQGPLRCGSLTDSDDTREEAGAGYYGVMELSGNLFETPVCVMDSQTGVTVSDFAGSHGDGSLSSTGFATNADWPGTDAQGAGFRGGDWLSSAAYARVSARHSAAHAFTPRNFEVGGRCASTAP